MDPVLVFVVVPLVSFAVAFTVAYFMGRASTRQTEPAPTSAAIATAALVGIITAVIVVPVAVNVWFD